MLTAATGIGALRAVLGETPEWLGFALNGFVGGLAILGGALVLAWLWNLARAPYLRDQSRQALEDELRSRIPLETKEVRIVQARMVPPPHQGFEFALEMVIQTTVPMSPVEMDFQCDREIEGAKIWPRIEHAPPMYSVAEAVEGHEAAFRLGSPPFLPETPLIFTLETKAPVRVIGFSCFDPTPPAAPPPTKPGS